MNDSIIKLLNFCDKNSIGFQYLTNTGDKNSIIYENNNLKIEVNDHENIDNYINEKFKELYNDIK